MPDFHFFHRTRCSLTRYVMLAFGLLAFGESCCLGASEPLVDELIAGCDANVALIDEGQFRYSVSFTSYRTPEDVQTNDVEVQFYLKGSKKRRDMGHMRVVVDDQKVISFDARYLDRADLSPRHSLTKIQTFDHAPQVLVDPRLNGSNQVVGGIGRILHSQRVRREQPEAVQGEIEIAREEDLVKVVILIPSMFHRAEHWVSPSHGYGIVRQRLWALKTPDMPYQEVESEFQQIANGAFIVAKQTQMRRVSDGTKQHDSERREIVLIDSDVETPVSDDVFTLAGLGLPKQSRLYDRISGKEYIYGVSAVTEADIGKPPLSGPDGTIGWRTIVFVASGIALVAFGFQVWRRRAAAKFS